MSPLSEFTEWVEPERCTATRGKRSGIRCEMSPGHKGEHGARGRVGQWFFWITEDPTDA